MTFQSAYPHSYDEAKAMCQGRCSDGRKLSGRETWVVPHAGSLVGDPIAYSLVYQDTRVVTFRHGGMLLLTHACWKTRTTRERMNACLPKPLWISMRGAESEWWLEWDGPHCHKGREPIGYPGAGLWGEGDSLYINTKLFKQLASFPPKGMKRGTWQKINQYADLLTAWLATYRMGYPNRGQCLMCTAGMEEAHTHIDGSLKPTAAIYARPFTIGNQHLIDHMREGRLEAGLVGRIASWEVSSGMRTGDDCAGERPAPRNLRLGPAGTPSGQALALGAPRGSAPVTLTLQFAPALPRRALKQLEASFAALRGDVPSSCNRARAPAFGDRPAGWAACQIDRTNGIRKLLQGGSSNETVAWAEAQPALERLRYDYYCLQQRKVTERVVHIFTDCQQIVCVGNKWGTPHVNSDVWAAIEVFRELGYHLTFHSIDRASFALHRLVDQLTQSANLLAELPQEDLYALLPMTRKEEAHEPPTSQ